MLQNQAVRVAMEEDLDKEWKDRLSLYEQVASLTCPRCGAAVSAWQPAIDRHKEWHRTLGH